MKWQGRRKSSNVEDRRGQSGGGVNFGGSGGGGINPMLLAPLLKMLFSKTGLVIVGGLILVMWLTGTNPLALLSQFTGGPTTQMAAGEYKASPEEEQLAEFTAVVLADTEDVWNQLMDGYREPALVLFTGQVSSACGNASAATGPFYCPGDEKVYIDLSFFQDMGRKLGAHGDFAQAYVIAHEVGHHVQRLDGTLERVQSKRGQLPEAEFNRLMVMLELQADFYAGVWAHHTQKINNSLEPGDIEEALNAASSVGDDRLQKQATGRVVPDSFTHGTSEQRSRWFKLGFDTGDVTQGDTFNARRL
ncbi:neutral zinc metallopeptidase [Cognataquiflexum rubidum]|uniref:KPN_02809 family neutral zinc metallopeptidase n=1 Tax=Cognataquiflexum rubidum TaxID=2922273 RepID=UPI001F13FA23|nr:neutral zinc metallopeptidase [Cognataquiflexum rubidum]MCH6232974.1 neutral zinc metallopeptidase [Cognataquiflexum rubidum]